MSRTPVREAINRLVAEGIFVGVPHSGVTIRHLGDRDLLDLLDVHEALMVQAARRAALTLQQTDLDELNRMIHEMSQVAVCADNLDDAPDRLRHLAAQWVEHLISLAAVDALTRLHHRQLALWEALWPNHWSHLPELQPFLHLPAWHTLFGPVMDALASRDPDLAARAVRTLMNHLRGKFSALFAMRVRLAHMTNG